MPPAVIAAGIMAGGGIASSAMNRGNKKLEQQAFGLQQQAAQRQSALANEISGYAKQQHTMAQPAINKAMQYYMSLAGSAGQGAMSQALSPAISNINSTYRGAEQGMLARMAPGAQRDQAIGDLYRQRAGQIGQAGIQGRQGAIEGLSSMGQNILGGANGMWGNAASVLGGSAMTAGQMGQQALMRGNQDRQMWQGIGANIGNILLPYLMQGGKSPLPSGRVNIPGMYGSY